MKKIVSIFIIFIFAFAVFSCGNKKNKAEDNVGYHTHEDGTIHSNDVHNYEAPAQESFEVKSDNDANHGHQRSDSDNNEQVHEHGNADGEDHGHQH